MTMRHVEEELEARLKAVKPGLFSSPHGKIERKRYADGKERLKVKVNKLKSQNGKAARITADGEQIAAATVENGGIRIDRQLDVPELSAGQLIEVMVDGSPVVAGKLYID